jgi:hypothetical protein
LVDAYKSDDTDKRDKQDWLARAAVEAGFDVPEETLDDSPDLREDLHFYLIAYQELSSIRPASFDGVMPLPYDKVIEYAERYKLEPEEVEEFCDIINTLDSEFRKFLSEKSEDKSEHSNDGTRNTSNHRPGNGNWRGKG